MPSARRFDVVEGLVSIEHVLDIPAVSMHTVPGFETAVFPYTTDVPLLTRWGTPLLIGPGSIHVAHTDDEHVAIDELMAGRRTLRIAGKAAALGRGGAVAHSLSLRLQPARTLHLMFAGDADVPGCGWAAPRPGPCATPACEPRQGRKAAALSRP